MTTVIIFNIASNRSKTGYFMWNICWFDKNVIFMYKLTIISTFIHFMLGFDIATSKVNE